MKNLTKICIFAVAGMTLSPALASDSMLPARYCIDASVPGVTELQKPVLSPITCDVSGHVAHMQQIIQLAQ